MPTIKVLADSDVKRRFDAALAEAGTMRALAAKVGCSAGYINDVSKGKRNVTGPLATFLGVERVTVFREIE